MSEGDGVVGEGLREGGREGDLMRAGGRGGVVVMMMGWVMGWCILDCALCFMR